jgi:outer membrane murein-binding lipoprotein Lpp
MAEKQPLSTAAASLLGTWLRNAALAVSVVLLGMSCYFVYRLSMIAYRVEQATVAVSSDVKTVTSTLATLSRDVSAMRDDIVRLKEKVQQSVPYEEVRHAIDEALAVGASLKAESPVLPTAAAQEIGALLTSLMLSGCRAEVGGKQQSVLTLYARLYAKYKLRQNTLSSAEDFIEQVASESVLGRTYYLVQKDGNRVPLGAWMKDRLSQMRVQGMPTKEGQ